ncbi:MAG: CidA/LrgA family protein [Trueperaceae bacterium]
MPRRDAASSNPDQNPDQNLDHGVPSPPEPRLAAARDLLLGLLLLTAAWAVGEGIAAVLAWLPLPGSVWGMLLLFGALQSGLLPEARVQRASALLVRWLGLLFVPVGVGIVAYGELVRTHAAAIVVAIGVGTVLTLAAAAVCAAALERWQRGRSGAGGER